MTGRQTYIGLFWETVSTDPAAALMALAVVDWILLLILPIFLIRRLNPVLDPIFAQEMEWYQYVPSFSVRWLRAFTYANWVGCRSFFSIGQPKVQAFDFRSKVSSTTYGLCVLFSIATFGFFLTCIYFTVGEPLYKLIFGSR